MHEDIVEFKDWFFFSPRVYVKGIKDQKEEWVMLAYSY